MRTGGPIHRILPNESCAGLGLEKVVNVVPSGNVGRVVAPGGADRGFVLVGDFGLMPQAQDSILVAGVDEPARDLPQLVGPLAGRDLREPGVFSLCGIDIEKDRQLRMRHQGSVIFQSLFLVGIQRLGEPIVAEGELEVADPNRPAEPGFHLLVLIGVCSKSQPVGIAGRPGRVSGSVGDLHRSAVDFESADSRCQVFCIPPGLPGTPRFRLGPGRGAEAE